MLLTNIIFIEKLQTFKEGCALPCKRLQKVINGH